MPRRPLRTLPLLLALALLLGACGGGSEPGTGPGTGPDPQPGADPAATAPTADEGTAPAGAAAGDPSGGTPTPGALEPSEPFGLAEVRLEAPGGQPWTVVPVYVAADWAGRSRGLMHRESLPAGTGMVFLFPEESSGGFWMKNTLIPLSIAFYDAEGTVVSVLDMAPCTEEPCEIYDPGTPYTGALEVNQGFFDEIGLTTGWRVVLPEDLPAPTA